MKPHRCEGHPAGPFDLMGQTVYCDGSCITKHDPIIVFDDEDGEPAFEAHCRNPACCDAEVMGGPLMAYRTIDDSSPWFELTDHGDYEITTPGDFPCPVCGWRYELPTLGAMLRDEKFTAHLKDLQFEPKR